MGIRIHRAVGYGVVNANEAGIDLHATYEAFHKIYGWTPEKFWQWAVQNADKLPPLRHNRSVTEEAKFNLSLAKGLGVPDTLPELRIFPGGEAPTTPGGGGGGDVLLDPSQGNLFNVIAQMMDIVNNLTEFRGQGSSSGYIHSGQRMVLPETTHATFLVNTPGQFDTTISVGSTEGFPSRGIITILNDVQQATKSRGNRSDFVQNIQGGTTTVEWIRYSGKTATQFLNCERGFLGTHPGPHAADFGAPRDSRFNRNRKDFCTFLDGLEIDICDREWPWWRQRRRFTIPFFGVSGFKRDLKIFIRRFGPSFPLNAGRDPTAATTILSVARDLSLLTFRDGTPFLQSKFQSTRDKGLLRWGEASSYVEQLIDQGAATEETVPDDFAIGTVPVFLGRLAVQHSLAAITRVTRLNMDAVAIVQTADGRVFAFIQDFANRDRTLQAIVNYQAYFISPPFVTSLRNNQ